MISELLKIIKEAENLVDSQSQLISEFDEKLKKVYRDLKEISEELNQAISTDNSSI